ncbi:cupin domain-containing protein [Chitinophaga nivalis]|uniref:Cupin domain-containing protein n=1 Tax=Chitinophaga nivalis TaxID=2991709 RepID=A0ABT3IMJ1_9BACT|nr:cupin domain-containing protein [Chitinophaga nivalis]MCW3465150.1 cupin domain-containing protein [Chitinophaga nivalis]MCW3485158.1 cupin domain-containing protein [Chitinophaga nivalis]
MNRCATAVMLLLMIVMYACGDEEKPPKVVQEQLPDTMFPHDKTIINGNFTGTAWLQMLVPFDTVYNTSIGNVTFHPGARSHWHFHPGGQILLITHGEGYYQEKGATRRVIRAGDVIKCPPHVIHWHGASNDSTLTHVAIGPNTQRGPVVWLQPVTDEEYNSSSR